MKCFIIYYLIFSIYYFLTMLGVLSMGFIVPSALYSSFFITTLRLYEWPSCS